MVICQELIQSNFIYKVLNQNRSYLKALSFKAGLDGTLDVLREELHVAALQTEDRQKRLQFSRRNTVSDPNCYTANYGKACPLREGRAKCFQSGLDKNILTDSNPIL